MTEFVIPPWIIPDEENIQLIDDNTVAFEPALGRGVSQRQSFGAPRFKISRKHTVRSSEEANLASTLSACSGKFISIRSTINRTLRGAFAASELLTNNQFSDTTTGWTVLNSSVHRVADRISSLIIGGAQTGSAGVGFGIYRSGTAVQYGAYAVRGAFLSARNVTSCSVAMGSTGTALDYVTASGTPSTLLTGAAVVNATTVFADFYSLTVSGNVYQDSLGLSFTSMARCALVDNGGNNLLRSDNFASTWAQNGVTVSTGALAGPILGINADGIVETVAVGNHHVSQSYTVASSAFDVTLIAYLKAGIRNFVFLRLDDNAGVGYRSSFNLTTGAVVSTTVIGAGFSNPRSFSQDVGNGWFLCGFVVRKTTSSTTLQCRLEASTDGTTTSYAGSTAAAAFYATRATSTLSSFPTRPTLSTTTQVAAASQTGSGIFIKGLPAATNASSLPGDFVEINGELKKITTSLDSDGLGLGYLQFKPEIIRSPLDNDPVIFFQPMGRFLVSNVQTRQRVADVELSYDLEQIYE